MRHLLLLVALVLLLSPEAYAQERGQTGITFGPNAFGFVFQVTDRVAIRPEAALAVTSSDTLDLTTWDVGLSTPFYVRRWDALRTYVVPRFVYGRTSPGSSTTFLSDSSNYDVSGAFGAQYALH